MNPEAEQDLSKSNFNVSMDDVRNAPKFAAQEIVRLATIDQTTQRNRIRAAARNALASTETEKK